MIGSHNCQLRCLLVMATLTVPTALAQSPEVDRLLGVWKTQRSFGHAWDHDLIIRDKGNEALATIGDVQVTAKFNGADLRFELPRNLGEFRGRREDNGSLSGHWIQARTPSAGYPYAFPLRFTPTGQQQWSARARTLPDEITLFLKIYQSEDGTLHAFIRNPDRNLGLVLGNRRVELSGGRVRLLGDDQSTPITGTLRGDGSSLTLTLPNRDKPFPFRKVDRRSAFYPTPTTEPYRYQIPEQLKDGWTTVASEEVGMRSSVLEEMIQSVLNSQTEGITSPYIHSILVARSSKLVLEEYFHGHDRETPHDTRSAGKSLGSMIVGAVLDRNPALTTETTIAEIFGDAFAEPNKARSSASFETRERWRKQITIGHALSMRSGLDADADDDASVGREGPMQDTASIRDWAAFARSIPMHREPNTKSLYSSSSINLAVTAVAHAEKQWLPDLLRRHITGPLGIDHYYSNLDPAGHGYYGGGVRMRPRDQLKLGQVMLANGVWNGQRVLSEAWVKQSTSPTGGINEPNDYCMGWWRKMLPFQDRTVELFHASGNGGQFIVWVPELEVVVQISGGNYRNFPTWYKHLTVMIPRYVFGAIEEER